MRYKFRAWDKTVKRIVTPDSLYHNVNFGLQCNKVFDGISTYTCLPEELILMQSTGLYDKNGKEIYEGDIIGNFPEGNKFSSRPVVVKFTNGSYNVYNPNCCNVCKEGTGCICSLDECLWQVDYDCEVIGNIYENPELLEQK